jgi:CheY-like chemotaxis protein
LSKPTILVVDDEPLNVAVLSELLSPDYRVLGARSGPIALDLLRAELPDLILLDVMMPDMDGYAVLDRLRSTPRTNPVPVVFVTALGAEVDEERGLSLGACDYIVKPVKPAVVLARVRTQIELKRRARPPVRPEHLARARGGPAPARSRGGAGPDPVCAGRTGRDTRQRDRQPHHAHAGLCRGPGAAAAAGPALAPPNSMSGS